MDQKLTEEQTERMKKFREEYIELVKKYEVDFVSFPQYILQKDGYYQTTIITTLQDKKYLSPIVDIIKQ